MTLTIGGQISRVRDWESALALCVNAALNRPFVWGEDDCTHFVADCLAAMTGWSPPELAAATGHYQTSIGARRWLTRNGFSGVDDLAARYLDDVHVARAHRGDVIYSDHDGGSLGISLGAFAVFRSETGLIRLPLHEWKRAFLVPYSHG